MVNAHSIVCSSIYTYLESTICKVFKQFQLWCQGVIKSFPLDKVEQS